MNIFGARSDRLTYCISFAFVRADCAARVSWREAAGGRTWNRLMAAVEGNEALESSGRSPKGAVSVRSRSLPPTTRTIQMDEQYEGTSEGGNRMGDNEGIGRWDERGDGGGIERGEEGSNVRGGMETRTTPRLIDTPRATATRSRIRPAPTTTPHIVRPSLPLPPHLIRSPPTSNSSDFVSPRSNEPRMYRKSNVSAIYKHFPNPSLPPSISPSDLISRSPRSSTPSATPILFSSPTLVVRQSPQLHLSPLTIDCDLPPSIPTADHYNGCSMSPIHSPPIASTSPNSYPITSSIPPLTCGINASFHSSEPKGPSSLFSSHSSSPLSVPLPRSYSSFHSSSVPLPEMIGDDHNAIARFHLAAFLKYTHPITIPDPTPPQTRPTHIVHCDKTRAFIMRAHTFLKDNFMEDMTPQFLSRILTIHPDTVARVITDSTAFPPLNRFPPCGPPPLKRTKKAEQERIKGRFNESTLEKLRRFVHVEYFAQYKRVTLKHLTDRKEEWVDPIDKEVAINTSTIRILLHSLNFSFIKLQYRSNIYMTEYYCRLQANFLRSMVEIRKEGKHLIWSVDETWVHKGMRPAIGWQDLEATKSPLTFIKNGLTAGNSRQWEKGERLIIVACMSEGGFRCPEIWRTGKKDDGGDYHKEMDGKAFEKYIDGVFKALVEEANEKDLKPVLLMDNAAYHSRVIDKMPTQSDRKAVMANWLKSHNMPCPAGWRKKDMANALKKLNRKDYNTYVVDTLGQSYGVQVVRTPPYMAEFAPIEFGWSSMKRAQHDLITYTDDGAIIRAKLLDWMNNFPADKCKSFMDHCERKRIEEGALTFTPPSLTTEEVVDGAAQIIDETDPEPVEDLDDLLFMADIDEEDE